MRFAGDHLAPTPVEQKPVLPSFNAEDLEVTPEMTPGPYYPGQDLDRDKYIRHSPRSGVASLRGTRPDPGPPENRGNENKEGVDVWRAPVKKASIEGQSVALAPALIPAAAAVAGKAAKLYGVYRVGSTLLDGGAVNPGTEADYNNQDPTTRYNRRKQNDYRGPATRSPYHQ